MTTFGLGSDASEFEHKLMACCAVLLSDGRFVATLPGDWKQVEFVIRDDILEPAEHRRYCTLLAKRVEDSPECKTQ